MQDDDTIDIIVGTTKNCILDGSLSSGLGIIVQVYHCNALSEHVALSESITSFENSLAN